ncbi:hypothetical protein EXW96_03380 [Paenibacillus sp. JMULE4]|uniref:hypothetical protein n=1 Tax=Paenibacillus sp. JMULE4 TaxID=2518342 RepID=UPI001575794F|nr:hypothetical protein [Paenibacillus sp. JMULE4]NTZ16647.1 hypothetical protein [Paenibacillus sp. JMULE4]
MPKWLIACVGENNRLFHFRMLTLFKTIKTFGGELAKAKLAACFVDEADQSISHELDKMGVHIHIVKPYHSNLQRHCNKIRMLEIEDDYDVMVALDCDTAVTRDFSAEISADTIRRCDSLLDPLDINEWKYMYGYFGLAMPNDEMAVHANSAVLFIPRKDVRNLRNAWLHYANLITDTFHSNEQWSRFAQHKYYTDQFALSMALADLKADVQLLPAEFNIHINGAYQGWADQLHPYILSYHHNVTEDGKLKTTGMTVPDQYISKVNEILGNHSQSC